MHRVGAVHSDKYFGLLCGLGDKIAEQARRIQFLLQSADKQPSFLSKEDDPFRPLFEALQDWDEDGAAAIVGAVADRIQRWKEPYLSTTLVGQWIRAHSGDDSELRAQAVIDCISTLPPEQVSIIRRLSTAGSQKLVFLANWHIEQREIALKRFIDPTTAKPIVDRELHAHALSNRHPNIIVTHLLHNRDGEPFLAEERLHHLLSDDWQSKGFAEAANLLYDIALALEFLKQKDLVHGDIKPDNIGNADGRFILLDFGICRQLENFAPDEATGSIRTRAPELLAGQGGRHSFASDIWSLGATVFKGVALRYPLFELGEKPPRSSEDAARSEFVDVVKERSLKQWEQFVIFDAVPIQLRPVLEGMLDRDPVTRWDVARVIKYCEDNLSAALKFTAGSAHLSPSEEIAQLVRFPPAKEALALMPLGQIRDFQAKLNKLGEARGLSETERRQLYDLGARLKQS